MFGRRAVLLYLLLIAGGVLVVLLNEWINKSPYAGLLILVEIAVGLLFLWGMSRHIKRKGYSSQTRDPFTTWVTIAGGLLLYVIVSVLKAHVGPITAYRVGTALLVALFIAVLARAFAKRDPRPT